MEDAQRREKNLEEAKKIKLTRKPGEAPARKLKIRDCHLHRGSRVQIYGWVHRLRRQKDTLWFIVLRDGTDYLQCVFSDLLVKK